MLSTGFVLVATPFGILLVLIVFALLDIMAIRLRLRRRCWWLLADVPAAGCFPVRGKILSVLQLVVTVVVLQ